MDRADTRLGVVEHALGAAGAYREEGAAGMLVYGIDGLAEQGQSAFGRSAAGAYYTLRTGRAITSTATGAAGLAFTAGTMIGDLIKENWVFNGKTLEDHVTDIYFNNLHGRIAERRFNEITSDENIERHRQMLRQQRFQSMSSANEQAAADQRLSATREAAAASDAAAAQEFTRMLLPAIGAAAAARSQQPIITPAAQLPIVAPTSSTTTSAPSNGRTLSSTPPLGSTFGSPPEPSLSPPRSDGKYFCPFGRGWLSPEEAARCR